MQGVVPCHLQALHAHQSRFGLQPETGEEDRGSQNENRETQRKILRICRAGQIV